MTKYIFVTSGKKGVGKTTTAVNFATALAQFNRNATLLDIDFYSQNLGLYLGNYNFKPTLQDVINEKNSINEAVFLHQSGLKVIPSGYFSISDQYPSDKLNKTITELFGKSEYVIINSSVGFKPEIKYKIALDSELLIITNPNFESIKATSKVINSVEEMDITLLGIVVNKVKGNGSDLSINQIKNLLKKPLLSIIPNDGNAKKSNLLGHPLVHSHPKSPASKQFKKLAELLL